MPPGEASLSAWLADQFLLVWAALVRQVQRSNGCARTGKACRETARCGCWLEAQAELEAVGGGAPKKLSTP